MTENLRKRLRWHARRGLLELDLLLGPFLAACLDTMEEEKLAALHDLLLLSDLTLLDLCQRKTKLEDQRLQEMVDLILKQPL